MIGRWTRNRAAGLTLIEVAISILLMGVLLTAMLNVVGASGATRTMTGNDTRAAELAEALLADILQTAYSDPDQTTSTLGPDGGESGRETFDDVDDFDNWAATPPVARDGTVLSDAAGYSQHVAVRWVDHTLAFKSTETGMKFILVTIKLKGEPVASVETLRSRLAERKP